jgi:hypothetical protein
LKGLLAFATGLLQFRVLGLGLLQDGDVGIGVFSPNWRQNPLGDYLVNQASDTKKKQATLVAP